MLFVITDQPEYGHPHELIFLGNLFPINVIIKVAARYFILIQHTNLPVTSICMHDSGNGLYFLMDNLRLHSQSSLGSYQEYVVELILQAQYVSDDFKLE